MCASVIVCVCVRACVTSGSRRSGVSSWASGAGSAEHRPGSRTGNTSGRTCGRSECMS